MSCPRPGWEATKAVIMAAAKKGLSIDETNVTIVQPKTPGGWWYAQYTTPDGEKISEQFRHIG